MNRIKAWLPAALWMGVIFMMSAMPGDVSGDTSGRLMKLLLWLISLIAGDEAAAGIPLDTLHLLIRKAAHMTEYAVLFLLYHRALRMENAKHPGMYALLMCAAYAATDEFHQGFVEARGPSAADVGIDTLGAGIAWGMTTIIKRKRR